MHLGFNDITISNCGEKQSLFGGFIYNLVNT